jgi:hypothetical protein
MPFWAALPTAEARWPSWQTNVTIPVDVAVVSTLVRRSHHR